MILAQMIPGQFKEFDISKTNRVYYDRFLSKFDKRSRATYKVNVGAFLSEIGTNDFAKITPSRIQRFASDHSETKRQRQVLSHIRSMMAFVVQNNINGAAEKVNKSTLIWMLRKVSDNDDVEK